MIFFLEEELRGCFDFFLMFLLLHACMPLFRKPSFKAVLGSQSSLLAGMCLIKLNLHLGKRIGRSSTRKAGTIWTLEKDF